MQLTCPHCGHRFGLEAATEDESGRALMALLGRVGPLARELVAYLGLFRPRTQALRWSRALALAMDVEHLATQHGEATTAQALRETVETMRARQGEGWQPLKNHNYLARVLESVVAKGQASGPMSAQNGGLTAHKTAQKPQSKTAAAMASLMEGTGDD